MRSQGLRLLAPFVLVTLTACTASWNAVVRYSDQPAPADQSIELGVYAAVLRGYLHPHMPSLTVLAPAESVIGPLAGFVTGRPVRVPGHWVDTLRNAVEAALADSGIRESARAELVLQAAAEVGLGLVPNHEFRASPALGEDGRPNAARLWLSRPGFNRDSTIAAVRVTYWCGMLCAHGTTLVLARRPGFQWRAWTSWLHWVS